LRKPIQHAVAIKTQISDIQIVHTEIHCQTCPVASVVTIVYYQISSYL